MKHSYFLLLLLKIDDVYAPERFENERFEVVKRSLGVVVSGEGEVESTEGIGGSKEREV